MPWSRDFRSISERRPNLEVDILVPGLENALALLPYLPFLLMGLGFLLGVLLAVWVVRRHRSFAGNRNRALGDVAEGNALRILKKLGFRLLEIQPVFSSRLWVDGNLRTFEVTPDFLVERNGKRFLVEVKRLNRGDASVSKADIRRQVLEYLHVSNLPCLLVQMPHGIIEAVALKPPQAGEIDRTN